MSRDEHIKHALDVAERCRDLRQTITRFSEPGDDAIEVLVGDTWHTLRQLRDEDWLWHVEDTVLVGFETEGATYFVDPVHIKAMRWTYGD